MRAEEVRLVSLPGRQTAELVQVSSQHQLPVKIVTTQMIGEGAWGGGEGSHLPQVCSSVEPEV